MSTVEGADPNNEEHIHLLPPDDDNKECQAGSPATKCGRGGDIRAAEQPVLTSLHTLFVHEHNRIATVLAKIQEMWTDEKLYQEARRLVIAIMQKIVYGEWLPIVLGNKTMEEYQLGLWNDFAGYDKTVSSFTVSCNMSCGLVLLEKTPNLLKECGSKLTIFHLLQRVEYLDSVSSVAVLIFLMQSPSPQKSNKVPPDQPPSF